MKLAQNSARLAVKNGLIVCPVCGRRTDQGVEPGTNAENLPIWCRHCKTRHIVNIASGRVLDCSRCP